MVDRILLFKLVDSAARDEVAAVLTRELATLPSLVHIHVGLPADEASAKSWDVSCVLRFATLTDLDAALAGATFQTCLSALAERCAVIKAWSFETGSLAQK